MDAALQPVNRYLVERLLRQQRMLALHFMHAVIQHRKGCRRHRQALFVQGTEIVVQGLGQRTDSGHLCRLADAAQGVQCTEQRVADRSGIAGIRHADCQHVEMFSALGREQLQKVRIGWFLRLVQRSRLLCGRGRLWLPAGKLRSLLQQDRGILRRHVVVAHLSQHLRQRIRHAHEELAHECGGLQLTVQHLVQDHFNLPGQFAQQHGPGHATTALEGMETAPHGLKQCAVVGVCNPRCNRYTQLQQFSGGLLQEDFHDLRVRVLGQDRQVGRRLHASAGVRGSRIDNVRPGCHDRRIGTTRRPGLHFLTGQAERLPYHAIHVDVRRPAGIGHLCKQLAQRLEGASNQAQDLLRGRYRMFDDPVQQLLHGPGKFPGGHGPHHASTALQGVKTAPDSGQQFRILRLLAPFRDAQCEFPDDLVRLFDEDGKDLGIRVRIDYLQAGLCTGLRFRLRGHVIRGRSRARLRAARRLQRSPLFRAGGCGFHPRQGQVFPASVGSPGHGAAGIRPGLVRGRVAEPGKAFLGHLDGTVLVLPVHDQLFDTILDAADRVGDGVEFVLVQLALPLQQLTADELLHLRGYRRQAALTAQFHAAADPVQDFRDVAEQFKVGIGTEKLVDGLLCSAQVGHDRLDHGFPALPECHVFRYPAVHRAGLAGDFDQRVLDREQRVGHIGEIRALVHRAVRLRLAQEALLRNHGFTQSLHSEHVQQVPQAVHPVGHVTEQLRTRLPAGEEGVQLLLDPVYIRTCGL